MRDPARERTGDGEPRRRPRAGDNAEALEAQRLFFEDVRTSFRSPTVPLLIRRLAQWQPYLDRAWRELKPNLLTRAFEAQADLLRAAAAGEAAACGAVGPGAYRELLRQRALSTSVVEDIVRAVDAAVYLGPKALLAAAALDAAFEGEPVGGDDESAEAREPILQGVPAEATDVPTLGDTEAPGRVLRLWNDVVATLGLPGVSDDLRAVGRWPDFLEIAWASAKPQVGRPGVTHLDALAGEAARRLPYRIAAGPAASPPIDLAPEALAEAGKLVKQFRRTLPSLVFTMALARYGLDETGRAATGASPFPV